MQVIVLKAALDCPVLNGNSFTVVYCALMFHFIASSLGKYKNGVSNMRYNEKSFSVVASPCDIICANLIFTIRSTVVQL